MPASKPKAPQPNYHRNGALRLVRAGTSHNTQYAVVEVYDDGSMLIVDDDKVAVHLNGPEVLKVIDLWERLGHRVSQSDTAKGSV